MLGKRSNLLINLEIWLDICIKNIIIIVIVIIIYLINEYLYKFIFNEKIKILFIYNEKN